MKKNYLAGLFVLFALNLAGCAKGTASSAASSGSIDPASLVDLKSAYSALAASQNYKIGVQLESKNGGKGLYYEVTYTNRYVYGDRVGKEWGYGLSDKGVYRLDTTEEGLLASEPLLATDGTTINSLYSSGLFISFADFAVDEFAANEQTHTFSNKKNKLAALKMAGFSTNDFFNLDSVETSISKQGLIDSFWLKVTVGEQIYRITIEAFADAKNGNVDLFLSNGGTAYDAPSILHQARDLFKDKNYSRSVIDYSDNTTNDGTEHFLPDYFYGDYNENGAKQGAVSMGWMGINHKKYNNVDLYGTYLFTLASSTVSLNTTGVYNASPDISSKGNVNYPSNLALWDRLEFVKAGDSEGNYLTTDSTILTDFADNYQIASSLSAISAAPSRLTIAMANLGKTAGTVTFKLFYKTATSAENYAIFPMFDFGSSNIKAVDNFMATSLA